MITHGTDTLEETAYFLDTMEVPHMPIILTGAMRSSNELGSDGVYNYLSALRVASDDRAADKGVLVVMNDEIHAAKYVTKTHTTNVGTSRLQHMDHLVWLRSGKSYTLKQLNLVFALTLITYKA